MNSKITAVTVFSDRAAITRTIKAQLDSGVNTLTIKDLPGNLLVDSLRVNGQSLVDVEITSVEIQRSFTNTFIDKKEAELQKSIQHLQDQYTEHQNQIEALDLQHTFMQSLIKTQPKIMREEMEIQQAWVLLQHDSAKMLKARSAALIAQRNIDKEINLVSQKINHLSTGQKNTINALITLETKQKTAGTFSLEYQIPGAGWQAMYDARLDSKNSELRIDQLAYVSQVTGEDWDNIQLSLSTHNPSINANFESLSPWLLSFVQQESNTLCDDYAGEIESKEVSNDRTQTGKRVENQIEFKQAEVSSTPFSAEYIIPGKVSLKSEKNAKKFKIQDQTFTTELMVIAAPQRSLKAYLHAHLNYTSDSPLLPGKVSLFRDNAYVGDSHLELLNPNEDMKLSFGIDHAIKIEHKIMAEKNGTNGFIGKRNYITRNYKTRIHSYHKQNINVRIIDRLPSSKHEDIKVDISANHTKPSIIDLHNNKGVVAWDFMLNPNTDEYIEFGYSINFPKDCSIH